MQQQTGWLAPSGDFYPCKRYDHVSMAEDICNKLNYDLSAYDYDDELLKRGWAKLGISILGQKQFYIRWERPLTTNQRYLLRDIVENPQDTDLPLDSMTLGLWTYEDDYFNEVLT